VLGFDDTALELLLLHNDPVCKWSTTWGIWDFSFKSYSAFHDVYCSSLTVTLS